MKKKQLLLYKKENKNKLNIKFESSKNQSKEKILQKNRIGMLPISFLVYTDSTEANKTKHGHHDAEPSNLKYKFQTGNSVY